MRIAANAAYGGVAATRLYAVSPKPSGFIVTGRVVPMARVCVTGKI